MGEPSGFGWNGLVGRIILAGRAILVVWVSLVGRIILVGRVILEGWITLMG